MVRRSVEDATGELLTAVQADMLNLRADYFPVNTGTGKTFGLDKRTTKGCIIDVDFSINLRA